MGVRKEVIRMHVKIDRNCKESPNCRVNKQSARRFTVHPVYVYNLLEAPTSWEQARE